MDKLSGPVAARPGWRWALDVSAAEHGEPMFLRIARAISADIRRGRLGPQTRLPGSRVLARTLEVHRNTVLAAYRELFAEGWIEARHGQGTFVATSLRDAEPAAVRRPTRRTRSPAQPGFLFEQLDDDAQVVASHRPHPIGALRLLGGTPDLRLVPHEALARAQRRVLRLSPTLLDYGDPYGHAKLRAAISGMLRTTRGLAVEPDDVLVTRGSQMALSLAAQTVLRPGDVVVVEALGYRPAWRALAQTGARVVALPVDEQGLRVPLLAAMCERETVRAVYVTPHHQYPSTVTLSPARRVELLALAAQARFAIFEDDYDHEFHYEGRPPLPLASMDTASVVVYIGTFSKVFAPGLRVGYVVAHRRVLAQLAARRYYLDRQGDHVTECALAELIEDGELQRHTRRMRRVYHLRRDTCAALLKQHLGDALSFQVPHGGMALWARVAPGIDVEAWTRAALAENVVIQSGRQFRWDGKPCPFIRVGYAPLNELELEKALRKLARALPA
jgi:GntR family transcriptional regulator/MocR family aminotransferase